MDGDGTKAATPRERYRAQVREEIKQHAWEQIAAAGASALSLNAIAKQMGLSGPALYRYFANRDELITELIRDAYQSLADTFRADSGASPRQLAATLRAWALDDPQRYLLIYGTPVPGYHAPKDTTRLADQVMAVLLDAFDTPDVPDADRRRGPLLFWTRLHGVLSLELAGHFTGMGFDPAELFDAEAEALSRR